MARDFDILYDCPLLTGNLDELPSFQVRGVMQKFIAYNPGSFNREAFISDLRKTIEAGVGIIGEIPYRQSPIMTKARLLEYVSTTKEIDYALYFSYAGLNISQNLEKNTGGKRFTIYKMDNMNSLQLSIFNSWTKK